MKKVLPSDPEIIRKKTQFGEGVLATLSQNRKTVKVTVRDKLRLVNDELELFKDSGISYRIICSLLADKLGLHVSEQTLREHCQQELGFGKRETGMVRCSRKAVARTAQVIQPVSKTLTDQAPAWAVPIEHKKTIPQEIEPIPSVTKQPTTEQTHHQPTHRLAVKADSQIAAQTEELFRNLEDY